jgi:hypothetical protein
MKNNKPLNPYHDDASESLEINEIMSLWLHSDMREAFLKSYGELTVEDHFLFENANNDQSNSPNSANRLEPRFKRS